MKTIGILGSTGSIGTQTIEVCRELGIKIASLTTNVNIELLEKQAREFLPYVVCVYNPEKAIMLADRLSDTNIKVLTGMEGLIECATISQAEVILTSVMGMVGLNPTISAIKAGKNIALANKETLVCAGEIIMNLAREYNVEILPVDSEHSAIFQALQGNSIKEVSKLILTASGGPFFGRKDLKNIKKTEALNHPNWSMGAKITIDSATLMNKGLEYIEAYYLYGISNIEVVVHPQSIIHSLVEYIDSSVMAQLGVPSMKVPIQYALTYPNRQNSSVANLNLTEVSQMTFFKPDEDTFLCLKLAKDCIKKGGNAPCVLNSANEQAVELFLNDELEFFEIALANKYALDNVEFKSKLTIDDVFIYDKLARDMVMKFKNEVR